MVMSRFKKLKIEESEQTFQLLNEEAKRKLKGGCTTCSMWLEEYPGLIIYTEDEYFRMCKEGTWTLGAVCGIGVYVLPNADVTYRVSGCEWHYWSGEGECGYCYMGNYIHCARHEKYFNEFEYCAECYKENIDDGNDPGSESGSGGGSESVPGGGGNSGTGSGEGANIEGSSSMDSSNLDIEFMIEADHSFARDAILMGLDSRFEVECFLQYWYGEGDIELSKKRFEHIRDAVKAMGVNYMEGMNLVNIDGKTYYEKSVSFYNNSVYNYALGTATVYFDTDGEMVGLYDEYNFDPKAWFGEDSRNFSPEMITRIVNEIGEMKEAKSFTISYGIYK